MRAPLRLALAAVASTALLSLAPPAQAIVVERIVAVVGDRPILLTELRRRAKPFLLQVQLKVPPGPQQAAAESQVLKELIEKIIDEELEVQAADKAKITVSSDEVDAAIRNVAQMQSMTVPELVREAKIRSGMSEIDYRDEIRRQILEGKMLQLRVKGRVRITEEDVKAMYERTLREERKKRECHPAWIVLRVLPGSSRAAIEERRALAADLVRRARAGESFTALAKAYSDDTATRDSGGDLGIRAPQGSQGATAGKRPVLAPELESVVLPLDPGQVSDPVNVGEALVILTVVSRQPSRYTTYEAAKGEMLQRLQGEILEKAKRKWLEELKGRTHLDVRL
ncbi:MAG: SurA N-terminal domain-containing protein [Minicystis sp.]